MVRRICSDFNAGLHNEIVLFFSPSGKLVQIEYALAAVASGAPSVGIKGLPFIVCTALQSV